MRFDFAPKKEEITSDETKAIFDFIEALDNACCAQYCREGCKFYEWCDNNDSPSEIISRIINILGIIPS